MSLFATCIDLLLLSQPDCNIIKMFAPSLLRITCDELLLFELLLKQVSLCEYIPILSCNTRASIATCLYKIGQADMVTVDGLCSQMNDHNHNERLVAKRRFEKINKQT